MLEVGHGGSLPKLTYGEEKGSSQSSELLEVTEMKRPVLKYSVSKYFLSGYHMPGTDIVDMVINKTDF